MTQEEKELLLKDLCARLPYGVIVDYKENKFENPHWEITSIYPETMDGWISYYKRIGAGSESSSRPFKIGEVKPYLRPMSSMTAEEKDHLLRIGFDVFADDFDNQVSADDFSFIDKDCFNNTLDFLLRHHIDFMSLIEKGLALEAPEGMYKNK